MSIVDFSIDTLVPSDRILVVSSREEVRASLVALLARREYVSDTAPDPISAIESATGELYDLVIYDAEDAVGPVVEAIERFRSHPALRRLPLLALHPDAGNPAVSAAFASQHDVQVLHAPYSPSELLVKVALCLRLRKLRSKQLDLDARITAQNAQLRDLTTRFQRELKEAQTIQQNILPKELPLHPMARFGARYNPLEAVGGDLYDIFVLEDGRFGLFLADVTGHGLPAAFIGAMSKMALAYAPKTDPAAMLTDMNSAMADLMPDGRFVAVTAAFYDAVESNLQIACGGNPSPCIWRQETKSVELVTLRGLPLAIAKGITYHLFETTLNPGDKCLLTTDGIVETTNLDGEMLGINGFARALEESAALSSIADCITHIFDIQNDFSGGRILKDDNTVIGVERLGSTES